MHRVLLVSLWALLAVTRAGAWDDEPARQLEMGFATRASVRGLSQAREGAFAVARFEHASFHALASWHQSFRSSAERLGSLGLDYELWQGEEGATVALSATHRRFAHRGRAGASRHTTELGATLRAAPLGAFVPSVAYHRDLRRDADLVEARVAREFALTRWGAFLTAEFFGGYVNAENVTPDRGGAPARDAYAYFGAEARLPYRIGERTMLVLTADVSSAHGASGAWSTLARAGRTRAGVGFSVTFDF